MHVKEIQVVRLLSTTMDSTSLPGLFHMDMAVLNQTHLVSTLGSPNIFNGFTNRLLMDATVKSEQLIKIFGRA